MTPIDTPQAADACSIAGCARPKSRDCDTCNRPLCAECWCDDEIERAREQQQPHEPRDRHARARR